MAQVHVNQVGYRSGAAKRAVAAGDVDGFVLAGCVPGREHSGQASPGRQGDPASGDDVRWLDFTGFAGEGRYTLSAGGDGQSVAVSRRPYAELKAGLLKGLYFLRCGCALDAAHAGPWTHGVCHEAPGSLLEDPLQLLDISGGWHDAGDYGKYIVPAAVAVAMLLLAYEHIPGAFAEPVGIPESGNGVPDLINEARWELEWMLKMQRADGGVYHKATTANFTGFVMPEDDHAPWVICPVSAAATADFAACCAMAGRVYADFDRAFSARLLKAATRAWGWLEANPSARPFHNPPGVVTGEYGDGDVRDERLWAAAALYRATGERVYAQRAEAMLAAWPDVDKVSFGWTEVGGFAAAEALFAPDGHVVLAGHFREPFLREAERLAELASEDGYAVPLAPGDYVWGSTMVLMNRAVHLLLASKLRPEPGRVQTAEDCLHWLCGRNPLGFCYISGFGVRSPRQQHYRPTLADGVDEPVPGLVSGGPTAGRKDEAVRRLIPEGTPPARCFVDDAGSYSTNEITIYWNTPALFVAAWFDTTCSS